jgi:GNAT superfamily N-acetyltransferase
MMDPEVRPAALAELGLLEALQMRASLAWDEYREALLAHPDAVQLPAGQIRDGHVFVALVETEIVGFCVVLPREDGEAELDGLFVDPGSWRSGVGSALVRQARQVAARRGATLMHVVATPRARRFYEACGFELTGDTPTRFGPALAMRCGL